MQAIITHTPHGFDLGWHRLIDPAEIICVKPKKSASMTRKEVRTTEKKKPKYDLDSVPFDGGWAQHEGDFVYIKDNATGKTYLGQIRIKPVRCGKGGCTKCPHKIYAYAQFRVGKKVTEKYLGVAR